MKFILILLLCFCLLGCAYGNPIVPYTRRPFVRSRYSHRWHKTTATSTTTTGIPQGTTAGQVIELAAATQQPKLDSSTANPDYDYYGNGEAEKLDT